MTKHYPHDNDAEIARLYREGETTYSIAKRFGVSPTPIRLALERQNVVVRPSGKRSRWQGTPEQREMVLSLYRQGVSVTQIAKRIGCRSGNVSDVLAASEVEVRSFGTHARKLTDAQVSQMTAEYQSGAKLTELAERYSVTHVTVRNWLVQMGVKLRDPGTPPFWTDERRGEAVRRYRAGESQQAIANDFGVAQSGVSAALRMAGIGAQPLSREQNGAWKGGRFIDGNGYVRVIPFAEDLPVVKRLSSGYVLEHRLVMARALGRPLARRETVHHINGDPTDNRLENLQLRQGLHGKGVVMTCKDCGSHNVEASPLK